MGMTDKKINQVLELYEKRLSSFDEAHLIMATDVMDPVQQMTAMDGINKLSTQLGHVKEMIGKIKVFLTEGRREKSFRWLGFIQGVFYSLGVYTIEEMADHNRPTKGDLREQYPEHSFDTECVQCTKEQPKRPHYCPSGVPLQTCEYLKEYRDAPIDNPTSN